ncbi:MAG: GTPase HflX, partial [Thermodesulfobacteriota bacterium]
VNGGKNTIDKIYGNTSGLTKGEKNNISRIYRRKIPKNEIITLELNRTLSTISKEIKKNITILINRAGKIEFVFIGEPSEFPFNELIGRKRESKFRLKGYRIVRTNLKSFELSQPDLITLVNERLDMIALVEVKHDGLPGKFSYAKIISGEDSAEARWEISRFSNLGEVNINFEYEISDIESDLEKTYYKKGGSSDAEGVILVGYDAKYRYIAENSLSELEALANSAGKIILDKQIQIRSKIDPRYLIGKGKLREIILHAKHLGAETIIFDAELTPTQAKEISKEADLKILDRSQLIIEIFAKHATTNEGKIQVRLAYLKYNLPRLRGKGIELSQLGGGIGTRGPGEKKLEQERRNARREIDQLEKEIDALRKRREHTRKNRKITGIPTVSFIGYTNVGKSTLFNLLTKSSVLTQDKLFSTLNPTTRKLMLPSGNHVLITDTVGFISKLPEELKNAFRATLEEIGEADLLVHIADASDPNVDERIESVNNIIESMNYGEIPRLLIFNKEDKSDMQTVRNLKKNYSAPVVSALDKSTKDIILNEIKNLIETNVKKEVKEPDTKLKLTG